MKDLLEKMDLILNVLITLVIKMMSSMDVIQLPFMKSHQERAKRLQTHPLMRKQEKSWARSDEKKAKTFAVHFSSL